MKRRGRPRLGVAALALGLLACGPAERPTYVYYEDFETVCDGAPCGWERSSGAAEQATWVETFHPGEHALRLTGSVGVRGPAASPTDVAARSDAVVGCVVARCDPGSALQLDVLFEDAAAGLVVGVAALAPSDEWEGPYAVSPILDATIVDASVTAIVITKSGSGACEIGELALEDRTFFGDDVCP